MRYKVGDIVVLKRKHDMYRGSNIVRINSKSFSLYFSDQVIGEVFDDKYIDHEETAELLKKDVGGMGMKKDKEWLKEEMDSMHRMRDLDQNPDEWFISKTAILEALNQLDEPEVLSQEWISDNAVVGQYPDGMGYVVPAYKLQNQLVPKQEVSMIPDYVAEWIETIRELNGDMVGTLIDGNYNMEVGDWLFLDDDTVNVVNSEKLMSAWRNGYTVEVKKYAVAVDHDNGDWTYASDGRNIFKTRFKSDATQLAKLQGGRVIRYEEGE